MKLHSPLAGITAFCALYCPAAAHAVTTIFFDNSQIATNVASGVTSDTVGSGGYRSAYVSTLIPLGQNATLGVAVQQTDMGRNRIGGRGYGRGYGGYGGGFYGDDLWGGRGGRQQSVALSLAIDGRGDRDATPQGCAPGGFRGGDGVYVEPLWVTQMRGDGRPCEAALGR